MVEQAQTQTMTLQAFKALPESNLPTELIYGEVVMSPAPKDSHQFVSMQLILALGRLGLAGSLRHQPTDLYILGHVLQPDIFWVSEDNAVCHLGEDEYWHGAPDLVIEILSPATELRDRREKYEIFQDAGVREYWLVDVQVGFIEVYQLEAGRFSRYGVFDTESALVSPVLNEQQMPLDAILGQKSDE